MKVKNIRVVQLSRNKLLMLDRNNEVAPAGLLALNYSGIGAEDGYKVYRTLRSIRPWFMDMVAQQNEIVHKHLTDDEIRGMIAYETAVDRTAEGIMSDEEYQACQVKYAEANIDIQPLLEDESDIDIRPVSFQVYYKIKEANKEILNFCADDLLEGILWVEE